MYILVYICFFRFIFHFFFVLVYGFILAYGHEVLQLESIEENVEFISDVLG